MQLAASCSAYFCPRTAAPEKPFLSSDHCCEASLHFSGGGTCRLQQGRRPEPSQGTRTGETQPRVVRYCFICLSAMKCPTFDSVISRCGTTPGSAQSADSRAPFYSQTAAKQTPCSGAWRGHPPSCRYCPPNGTVSNAVQKRSRHDVHSPLPDSRTWKHRAFPSNAASCQ